MKTLLFIIILTIGLTYTATVNAADSTVNYKNQPPTTAISPSLSIGSGSDVCVVVRSGSVQTTWLGVSSGIHVIDKNCERIKLSRALAQLGLKVSATAMLCQDKRVFKAMLNAGSPCPIDGLIGEEAKTKYKELGIIDEQNNLVGNPNVKYVDIGEPRRHNDYGQPTQ
jgi:hypothetical protein